MIKAIIFDWGGVLAPSDHKYAAAKLQPKYGFDKETFLSVLGDYEEKCGEGPNFQPFLDAIQQFEIPQEELIATLNETAPNELYTFAQTLKEKYTLALLSNQIQLRADAIKRMYDLSFFDYVFFSCEMGTQKPKRDPYQKVLDALGLPAEECLFVDDRKENIEAAQQLGIQTLHCVDVKEAIAALKKL